MRCPTGPRFSFSVVKSNMHQLVVSGDSVVVALVYLITGHRRRLDSWASFPLVGGYRPKTDSNWLSTRPGSTARCHELLPPRLVEALKLLLFILVDCLVVDVRCSHSFLEPIPRFQQFVPVVGAVNRLRDGQLFHLLEFDLPSRALFSPMLLSVCVVPALAFPLSHLSLVLPVGIIRIKLKYLFVLVFFCFFFLWR